MKLNEKLTKYFEYISKVDPDFKKYIERVSLEGEPVYEKLRMMRDYVAEKGTTPTISMTAEKTAPPKLKDILDALIKKMEDKNITEVEYNKLGRHSLPEIMARISFHRLFEYLDTSQKVGVKG